MSKLTVEKKEPTTDLKQGIQENRLAEARKHLVKDTWTCLLYTSLLSCHPWRVLSEVEKRSKHQKIERINRIIDYIDNRYMDKILLGDLAESEGLSMAYLSHLFMDTFNQSFQQYVAVRRFEKARLMLDQTSLNITEISLSCGFSDPRYMTKIFMKQLGISPSRCV